MCCLDANTCVVFDHRCWVYVYNLLDIQPCIKHCFKPMYKNFMIFTLGGACRNCVFWMYIEPLVFSSFLSPRVFCKVGFASLLYETFMKRDQWHKVEEHVCVVGPCTWASCKHFQSKNLRQNFINGDDNYLHVYFVHMFHLMKTYDICQIHKSIWLNV